MPEHRDAKVSAQDIADLEDIGYALFRHHETERALQVLALALKLRTSTQFPPEWDVVSESLVEA